MNEIKITGNTVYSHSGEMVERVAFALQSAMPGLTSPEAWPWKTLAIAAIEAMLVPTAAQGQAIYAAWDAFGEDAIMGPKEAVAIYRAAIDEALK